MSEPIAPACISDEAMASYLEGNGDASERHVITAHLAICSDCYETWRGAKRLQRDIDPLAPPRVHSRRDYFARFLLSIAGIVAASGAIQYIYKTYHHEPQAGTRFVALAANTLQYRVIVPRLAGFSFRPLAPTARGTPKNDGMNEFQSALAIRQLNPMQPATSRSLHELGITALAMGDVDRGEDLLRRALEIETNGLSIPDAIPHVNDAELLSDLGAAKYALGNRDLRTEEILTSIDLLRRALRLQPRMTAAAFNLALAVESIHSHSQAIAAWNDYLHLETDDAWAAEAHRHLQRLQQNGNLGTETPLPTETWAASLEKELLPAWADAYRRNDSIAAERSLNEALALAQKLHTCCGDEMHIHAVRHIEAAVRWHRTDAERLALAHQQYRDAYALYAANQTSAAQPLFQASLDSFRNAGDVFAVKPWKYVAACFAYLGDSRSALREAGAGVGYCASDPACSAAARAHLQWVQGLAAGRAGDPQQAITFYSAALKAFDDGKELQNAASIRALISENLEFLGVGQKAWPQRTVALKAAERSGTLDRIFIAFNEAAEAALRQKHVTSAGLFQDVVVDAARREKNTLMLSNALFWRAKIRHAAGDGDAARRDLDEADALAGGVNDPQRRDLLRAGIAATRAELVPPAEAVVHLTRAIDVYTTHENHYRLAELLGARAEAEEVLGQSDLAEADYLKCIGELESSRERIEDSATRERFFAQGSGIFDRVIRHFWLKHRSEDAFRLAEQSRAREIYGTAAPALLTTKELSARLRDGDAVVEYALLQDRMVIWIIRRTGTTSLEAPVPAAHVAENVRSLQAALQKSESPETYLTQVGALVYGPIAPIVHDATRLVIVANKSLRAVPFSALRDPSSGKYLIENHEIAISPSAATYVRAVAHDRELSLRVERPSVLVSAYTRADGTRGLAVLEHGREEADALHQIYTKGEWLDESSATPTRVLDDIRNATVAHLVAHGLQNDDHPEYSSIALAPGPDGRDLYAHSIAKALFRTTRLVVLSICGDPGRMTSNSPPLTLPESFLAAGVPVIVGALRPVDDAATVPFAVAFHRAFAASGDAIASLRVAQLQCLRSPAWRHPRFWSSWTAIGGGA